MLTEGALLPPIRISHAGMQHLPLHRKTLQRQEISPAQEVRPLIAEEQTVGTGQLRKCRPNCSASSAFRPE
jgi:hypothetical protein